MRDQKQDGSLWSTCLCYSVSLSSLLRFRSSQQLLKEIHRVGQVNKFFKPDHFLSIFRELQHNSILVRIRPDGSRSRTFRKEHTGVIFSIVDHVPNVNLQHGISQQSLGGASMMEVRTVKSLKCGANTFIRSRYFSLVVSGRPMESGRICCVQSGARKAIIASTSQEL
jgi:hypothetical protein